MLIEVTHTTELTYAEPIRQSVMELRVCPAQLADQVRLGFDLAIGPAAQVHSYFDWLDNPVHAFAVDGWHDRLRIAATSVVQTDRRPEPPETLLGLPGRWPLGGEAVDADYAMYDFLGLDGPIGDSPALRALAAEVKAQDGEFQGAVVLRALELMKGRFAYVPGVTASDTPVAEFLELRQGVCQDFTHAFIGVLRCLGIPARYVSGLVHDDRTGGQPDYLGASQTHAWAEAYFPELDGGSWVGLDPTNAVRVGPAFVKVAVGRHYGDVPPNRGVYLGGSGESIEVEVKTRRLSSIPTELIAERYRPLGLAATPAPPIALDGGGQQQQQQQQSGPGTQSQSQSQTTGLPPAAARLP